jgi:hypothetical protein
VYIAGCGVAWWDTGTGQGSERKLRPGFVDMKEVTGKFGNLGLQKVTG